VAEVGGGVTVFGRAQFILIKFVNFLHRLLFDVLDLAESVVIEGHIQVAPFVVVGKLAGSVLVISEAVVGRLLLQFVVLFVCGNYVSAFVDDPH